MYGAMQRLTYSGIAELANSMTPLGWATVSVGPSPEPVVFRGATEGP